MELTTLGRIAARRRTLFMMSKIQNLNGTHNSLAKVYCYDRIVYDVKDTKFEWNSQLARDIKSVWQNCL